MDRVGADFENCVEEIREKLGKKAAAAFQIPIGAEDEFQGVIDLIEMKAKTLKKMTLGQVLKEEIPADLKR